MRVEDGVPTVDLEITTTAGEQQFFHYTPGVKVYCSKVTSGRKCTFITMNNEEIEVVLFPGTTIPLCSRACKFEDSVTSGEQIIIFNSKLVESYPVLPGQSAYLVQHCSYKNDQNKQKTHHVHIHDAQLIVGKVYKLQLDNGEVDWFTVVESHDYTGIEIVSVIEGPQDECDQMPTPTPTPTNTPTLTNTPTYTPTQTVTPTYTPSQTVTPSVTPTITSVPTQVASFSLQWTVDATDSSAITDQPPATMQEIFNTWDRCLPSSPAYYTSDTPTSQMSTDAAAWYYDSNLQSFVQPNNTGNWEHFVSPPGYYGTEYTHDVIVKSSSADDDGIGVSGAFLRDEQTGHNYSILFVRTHGGVTPNGGWGVIVQASGTETGGSGSTDTRSKIIPGYTTCGLDIGGVARNGGETSCAASIGTNGWSNRTSRIRVERSGNIITAWCSPWGASSDTTRASHTLDPASQIIIDLDNTPFPSGFNLTSWDIFKQPTGVGFNTLSQPNSYYLDWSYTPPIGEQMVDMSSDADGTVYEWNTEVADWFVAADNIWDYVGRQNAIITDPRDGKSFELTCVDYTCETYNITGLPWRPSDSSSLFAWYDPSDSATITLDGSGVITSVDDKSGNNYNLVPRDANHTPTITTAVQNGLDGFEMIYERSDCLHAPTFPVPDLTNTSFCVVMLYKNTFSSNQSFLMASQQETINPRLWIRHTATDSVNMINGSDTLNAFNINHIDPYIITPVYDGVNSRLRYDGSQVAQNTNTSRTFDSENISSFTFGGNESGSQSITGFIGEIVVLVNFNGDDDIQRAEGYIAHKWGLTSKLPTNHPYKNNPPTRV